MKAADYAARILAAGDDEEALRDAIAVAVRGLAEEGAQLFKQRGRGGAAGIARELDLKWRAIVARCPDAPLNPNGWRDLMRAGMERRHE